MEPHEPQNPRERQEPIPSICQHFIQRKSRQCKFPQAPNSLYCHSHAIDLTSKMECPYEKGFYIDKNKLQKHLLNCPKIKVQTIEKTAVWFKKDVNISGDGPQSPQCALSYLSPQIQASMIHRIIEMFLHQFGKANLKYFLNSSPQDTIENIKIYVPPDSIQQHQQQQQHHQQQQHLQVSNDLQQPLQVSNDLQQAILITACAQQHHLISNKFIYIQLGAGKGILSYCFCKKVLHDSKSTSKHMLLEREARRMKYDRYFKYNGYFQRFKGDVRHFDFQNVKNILADGYIGKIASNHLQELKRKAHLSKEKLKKMKKQHKEKQHQEKQYPVQSIPQLNRDEINHELQDCKIVAICKHMCGQALDISLFGIMKLQKPAYVLAACCHHICSVETYINNDFLLKYFSKEEIPFFFKFSSWGTKTSKIAIDDIEVLQKKALNELTIEQKTIVGRMCKRLIDLGRAKVLNGKLVRYCSDILTPENFVILSL